MLLTSATGDHCPACTSAQSMSRQTRPAQDVQGQWISVLECAACGFAWQWPVGRSVDDSVDYFDAAYASAEAGTYFDVTWRKAVADLRVAYLQGLGLSGQLLDIGCGDGIFAVTAAGGGFDCVGLDVALPPAAAAAEDLPCVLVRGTTGALDPAARFDVVTLWDIIEHVEDPAELVAAARARLKPGGWLVVETGNYQSADRIEAGDDWWCYQTDHRWYFAPGIMRTLLETQGFNRFHLCERPLRPGLEPQTRGLWRDLEKYAKTVIRQPARAAELAATFRKLRRARREWPAWCGLGMFTLAARLPE